jgi:hypothetical protein
MSRTIRRATLVTALALVLTIPVSGEEAETVAPSTSPAPSADAAAPEPVVTDEEFPYPLVAPPSDVPLPPALQPKGRPDASSTRNGVRVELWLSSPIAEAGEWLQAVVRTTNLRRTPAWFMPYPCLRSGTVVGIDARSGIPPGEEQQGNAVEFKKRAVRKGPYLWAGFDQRRDVLRWVTSSASTGANWTFVECTQGSEPRRLGPRGSVTERFAWYPASSFDEDEGVWFQPLWPGTATVTASWPFLGRGARPVGDDQDLWRRTKRIEAATDIEIAGDGPGTPSIAELVDAALADPRFKAWVEEDPSRESWTGVSWGSASGPTYPHNLYAIGLEDAPPTGLVWLELDRVRIEPDRHHQLRGVVTLDPWTGEVLRVHCIGPSSPQCSAPTILEEAAHATH